MKCGMVKSLALLSWIYLNNYWSMSHCFQVKFNLLIMELVPPPIFYMLVNGTFFLSSFSSQKIHFLMASFPSFPISIGSPYPLSSAYKISLASIPFSPALWLLWKIDPFVPHRGVLTWVLPAPHLPYKTRERSAQIMSLRGSKVWEWWVGEMLPRDRRSYEKSVSDDTRQAGFQILSLPLPVVSSRASASLECNLTVFDFEIIIHTWGYCENHIRPCY